MKHVQLNIREFNDWARNTWLLYATVGNKSIQTNLLMCYKVTIGHKTIYEGDDLDVALAVFNDL